MRILPFQKLFDKLGEGFLRGKESIKLLAEPMKSKKLKNTLFTSFKIAPKYMNQRPIKMEGLFFFCTKQPTSSFSTTSHLHDTGFPFGKFLHMLGAGNNP